jgi:type IV pilus biogenesis protein CpaD/CtpE
MRSVLAASLLVVLAGCATSHVMVGNARPAISPDQVKIYLHPPEKYEEIAILDTSSQGSFSFTQQGKMDVVVERLKAEAAKLGANGILLESTGDRYAGSVSTGAGTATASGNTAWGVGTGLSAAAFQKAGSGVAIYVADR